MPSTSRYFWADKHEMAKTPQTNGPLKDANPKRDFFHRISLRKGRVLALYAPARKRAVIIWNLAVKGVS
jgi:hypothetical protein